ncbi:unnamed protein product [Rotaria sp. Silwood2]|nr:unnamed protein product [Rotaria sp. Silwood2]
MAKATRRRFSFVDLAHPQVWHKLVEYTEVTIAFAKLITDFNNQWAKICLVASSQLHQLVIDFRRKTESEIRVKCHLGGMMYDLWESLLLESEIESQSLKKVASVMEKEICGQLTNCITNQTLQLKLNKEHRRDLDEILEKSHEYVQELQEDYSKIFNTQGVTSDFDLAHNEYIFELAGVNSLYSKYQYNILPDLLQGMEQSQLETIDAICQNIQLMASVLQQHIKSMAKATRRRFSFVDLAHPQHDLLKSHRPSISCNTDNEQDAHKRSSKNIKGLWRDACRALKTSTTGSGSSDNENLSVS